MLIARMLNIVYLTHLPLVTHICGNELCQHRVGQSLEILFEFGSTFATALAVSEAYPATELAACGGRVIDPKHQIVYLAHVTRCWRCSKMRLSVAEPVWNQTAAFRSRHITRSTFNILRRITNPFSLLNWWLHKYGYVSLIVWKVTIYGFCTHVTLENWNTHKKTRV